MNKVIDLRIVPRQGLVSRILPLSLALLIALPGIAVAQNTSGQPAEDRPAAATPAIGDGDQTGAKQGKAGSTRRGTAPPAGDGRWVPRIDYKHCPNGTTTFVGDDGGVKCWAGPVK